MRKAFFSVVLIMGWGIAPFLLFPFASLGQGASFDDLKTLCLNETYAINNTSTNTASYSWDFCLGDFAQAPSITTVPGAPIVASSGIKIVESGGNYFGFATAFDAFSSGLYRMEFGSSLSNLPVITFMGSIGLTGSPVGIDIVKDGTQWIGIVGYGVNGGQLRRVIWNSLTDLPTVQSLGNFGFAGRIWDLVIQKQGGDYVVVAPYYNGNTLIRINFGASLLNNPTIASVTESASLTNVSLPTGLTLLRKGGIIYVLVNSQTSKNVSLFSLGNDLFSAPTHVGSKSFTSFNNLSRIKGIQEGSKYYAFVSNTNGTVKLLDLGSLDDPLSYTEIPLTGTPIAEGVDVVNVNSTHYVIGTRFNIFRMIFDAPCSANPRSSTDNNPVISYNSAGSFDLWLSAFLDDYNFGSLVKQAAVINEAPPFGNLVFESTFCVNNQQLFHFESMSTIVSHNWDFGDSQSSSMTNPQHQYSAIGEYEVSLEVSDDNGCIGYFTDDIAIYSEPLSSFSLPSATPICTNQGYTFTNTSAFDAGSDPIWDWQVNGVSVATTQDLMQAFATNDPQQIKLISSIPGCSNESMQTLSSIEIGPLADFTFNNGCVETSIDFNNTTAGTVTGYAWDFGDSNTSSQTNGSNIYTSFGEYDVTLTASNPAGCNNSMTKPITIYSKPQPDFSVDLPPFSCSGSPSQFNDLTSNPTDSNLAGWTWSFGDPSSGSSTTRNPLYTYDNAGSYDVQLDVITNFGCSNSVQKTINIAQSPPSGFSFNAACVNQGTIFTPNAINGINSWQWTIGAATYSSQSPIHIFSFPSTYNAQLTVTGNNGCVAISSQPITVPTVPSLDFSASNLCEDQPVEFMDVTSIGLDVPTAWTWEFGTAGTAAGKNPSFTFDNPGSYPTKMTVTNQSGCRYSISKNISIVTSPTATFTATPQIGTAPLVVQLTNTTTNSNSQVWTINGTGETSTDDSPAFTFDELGDYVIDLTVTNDQGCESTASKTVSVVIPTLDLELTSLTVVPAVTGEQRLLVSIKNNSNSTIAGPKLAVDIAGQAVINELLNVTLLPGATHTQMLATQVVGARGDLDYICVEIILDGDFNKSNDKKCVGTNSISILDPYPNPSTETVNLEWISEESGNAQVYIFNSVGNKVFENAFANFQPGLNRVAVDVDNLNPGIYYLLFVTGDNRRSFPVIIRR